MRFVTITRSTSNADSGTLEFILIDVSSGAVVELPQPNVALEVHVFRFQRI